MIHLSNLTPTIEISNNNNIEPKEANFLWITSVTNPTSSISREEKELNQNILLNLFDILQISYIRLTELTDETILSSFVQGVQYIRPTSTNIATEFFIPYTELNRPIPGSDNQTILKIIGELVSENPKNFGLDDSLNQEVKAFLSTKKTLNTTQQNIDSNNNSLASFKPKSECKLSLSIVKAKDRRDQISSDCLKIEQKRNGNVVDQEEQKVIREKQDSIIAELQKKLNKMGTVFFATSYNDNKITSKRCTIRIPIWYLTQFLSYKKLGWESVKECIEKNPSYFEEDSIQNLEKYMQEYCQVNINDRKYSMSRYVSPIHINDPSNPSHEDIPSVTTVIDPIDDDDIDCSNTETKNQIQPFKFNFFQEPKKIRNSGFFPEFEAVEFTEDGGHHIHQLSQ